MSQYNIKAIRYSGPPLARLDESGKRIYFRGCDLVARFWLNFTAEEQFDAGNREGCCMLIHAERYLADRLAYELAPWPKGKVRVEPDDAYSTTPPVIP